MPAPRMHDDVWSVRQATSGQPILCFGPGGVGEKQLSGARACRTWRRQPAGERGWTFVSEANIAVGEALIGSPFERAGITDVVIRNAPAFEQVNPQVPIAVPRWTRPARAHPRHQPTLIAAHP